MSPFDILNSVNQGTKGPHLLNDDIAEKQYVPFIVNKGLSYFFDTVLFANEMNRHHHLDERLQYDFYRNSLSPKKRFSKWSKKKDVTSDIKLIQKAYDYSQEKAEVAYSLLTQEALDELRKRYDTGGISKKSRNL